MDKRGLIKKFEVDRLDVEVYSSRAYMGQASADEVERRINEFLKEKDQIVMVFAAAPSQDDFLKSLSEKYINWNRIIALHLDEYIGLSPDTPQRFSNYLKKHIFDIVKPKEVFFIDDGSSTDKLCARYEDILKKYPIDIACIGIGENGHIAFNDPHVADFNDKNLIKIVELDEKCRIQQVHDGCFSEIKDVPTHAITLTIPAIMASRFISCVVPGTTKAEAVKATLKGPISEECPASILRRRKFSQLYLDSDSSNLLLSSSNSHASD